MKGFRFDTMVRKAIETAGISVAGPMVLAAGASYGLRWDDASGVLTLDTRLLLSALGTALLAAVVNYAKNRNR